MLNGKTLFKVTPQAVADQVLSLLIREIVERLQHHDLELQDRIVGLATSVALALLGLRLGHALDVSAEVLPPHDLLDRFQRITFGADRLKPALNIEKARLSHDSLAPSAHGPLPLASQIRSDLARRIFRGALKGFVRAVWETDATVTANGLPNPAEVWSKPDVRTGSLELRRITTRQSIPTRTFSSGVRSDFYELYWADLSGSSTWSQVQDWIAGLLLRNPVSRVPYQVLPAWIILWI